MVPCRLCAETACVLTQADEVVSLTTTDLEARRGDPTADVGQQCIFGFCETFATRRPTEVLDFGRFEVFALQAFEFRLVSHVH